jgi:alpha-ribazole phosphatase
MRVYFTRHGQTNYNVLGLCNDDPATDARLTALGASQAEQAALALKDASLELIVVSELPRTHQTAEIINRHHGAKIVVHPAINDIVTGFNNRPAVEHRRAIAHDPLHAKPPGGESILEHKQRVLPFINWLVTRDDNTVLVVSHEEPLRVCIARLRGLTDQEMLNIKVGNCEILPFDLAPGTPRGGLL